MNLLPKNKQTNEQTNKNNCFSFFQIWDYPTFKMYFLPVSYFIQNFKKIFFPCSTYLFIYLFVCLFAYLFIC